MKLHTLALHAAALALTATVCLAQNWHGSPAADSNAKLMDDPAYLIDSIRHPIGSRVGYTDRVVPLGVIDPSGYPSFAVNAVTNIDTNSIDIFRGGNPFIATPYQVLRLGGLARTVGDLDHDGYLDLIAFVQRIKTDTSELTYLIRIFWGTASGVFDTLHPLTFRSPAADDEMIAADIDGDGRTELLAMVRGGLYIYKFDSSRTAPSAPWFLWATPEFNVDWARLQVTDVDNDGLPDAIIWTSLAMAGIGTKTYILWGRKDSPPDTIASLIADNNPLEVFPIYYTSRNDILRGRYNWAGGDTIKIYHGFTRRFTSHDLDTATPAFVLLDPATLDPDHYPFTFSSIYPAGLLNGSGEPSLFATAYHQVDIDIWQNYCILYSAGSALDTRFDAALDLSVTNGATEHAPVSIGDIDGDGLTDAAIPDRWGQRIFLIRGSTDYPHKPVKLSVPDAVLPIGVSLLASPNPFRTETRIAFMTPKATSRASLRIFDPLGRLVWLAHGESLSAGGWEFRVRVSGWPAGVYHACLRAGGNVQAIVIVHVS